MLRRVFKARRAAQPVSSSLQALTVAALALPGLMLSSAHADDSNEATFQYGYYQEGQRQLFGQNSQLDPIHVDTINTTGGINLLDRVKLGFNYVQDTWSGATPITTTPLGYMSKDELVAGASSHVRTGQHYVDKNFNPLQEGFNPVTGEITYTKKSRDQQLVHMVTSASPETRKQADFRLGYEWDEAALDIGGGVSVEPDYDSHFINANTRVDFNQKLTTFNTGLSYTSSHINAQRDPNGASYIDYSAHSAPNSSATSNITGQREDWATHFDLTQVLNKNAVLAGGFGFTRSSGFLENPYKAPTFVFKDPKQFQIEPGVYSAVVQNVLENRPGLRNQFTWDMRFVQYIAPLDAALHFDYRYFLDDWGINAHTFDASWDQPVGYGWTITPRIRYYSQDAADFYQPIFYFNQAKPTRKFGKIDFSKLPISNFSSDQRLSGYGALSGGVTFSKQFAKGVNLEAGVEYYTHQGALKIGGGGEGDYADFDYYLVNAALKVDLAALSLGNSGGGEHSGHDHQSHHSAHAPAGVMFEHMLSNPGDVMVGYRYMYSHQGNHMLHGSGSASDRAIASQGCGNNRKCTLAPSHMDMHMHMLDLMYAPTDWLNLMLMPQFVDMNMSQRSLAGISPPETHDHETGGVGDTSLYALVKLLDIPGHHLHTAVGISAPTGDVGIKLNAGGHHGSGTRYPDGTGGFIHYGMQLGSGTWDFKPSVTYTGQADQWFWGAQLNGTVRLEDQNASGFILGDVFQSSVWGGYNLLNWLSASVRGVYTEQGKIRAGFNEPHVMTSPVDLPFNYGGRYWDVGFGVSAFVPSGDFANNRVSFEWLQPVEDDVNGYQLRREGALSATWSLAF